VPYPSNDQKMPLTECFRCVLTMVLDGFQFLELWGSGGQGWVRTVWLKRNHAPGRDNLQTVRLKIARSCTLPFKWSKDVRWRSVFDVFWRWFWMGFNFWNSGEVVTQALTGGEPIPSVSGFLGNEAASLGKGWVRTVRLKTQSRHCPVQWRLKRIWKGAWSQNDKFLIFAKRFDMKSIGFRRGVGFRIPGKRRSLTWQGLGTYSAA
jgi:hypothetical protein